LHLLINQDFRTIDKLTDVVEPNNDDRNGYIHDCLQYNFLQVHQQVLQG